MTYLYLTNNYVVTIINFYEPNKQRKHHSFFRIFYGPSLIYTHHNYFSDRTALKFNVQLYTDPQRLKSKIYTAIFS